MSRFSAIQPDVATGLAADLFKGIRKAAGKVPNAYATVGTHSPEALAVVLQADDVLSKGSLERGDIETVKLVVSEESACDYCLAAHTMIATKMAGLSPEAVKQIRAGQPSGNDKRDALARFVRRLVSSRGTVPEDAVAEVRAAGYGERQVIETILAISVITFTNMVNRVNDTTLDFPPVN